MEENKSTLERKIYENALIRMEKFGVKSIMAPRLLEKRDTIKSTLLEYYESTEEFEKCKFVFNFFNDLEKELKISTILDSIKKNQ